MISRVYRCWLPILLSYAFIFDAFADTSDFGTSGLIKMPSARMAADGTLRATISKDELANNFNITFQALPRVQATFRYTIFDPDGLGSGSDPLRDRSYGVKAQLLPETHLSHDQVLHHLGFAQRRKSGDVVVQGHR